MYYPSGTTLWNITPHTHPLVHILPLWLTLWYITPLAHSLVYYPSGSLSGILPLWLTLWYITPLAPPSDVPSDGTLSFILPLWHILLYITHLENPDRNISQIEVPCITIVVELWHSIPRVAFLAFTKTNKILKEKLG
jgi:hypothetical protein